MPIAQSLLIILTTCAGGVFFFEFAHATRASMGGFLLGVAAAMVGVAILSQGGGGGDDDLLDGDGLAPMEMKRVESREGRRGTPESSLDNLMADSGMPGSGGGAAAALDIILETPEDSSSDSPQPQPQPMQRRHSMRNARYSIGMPILTAQKTIQRPPSLGRARAESMPMMPPACLAETHELAALRSRCARSRSMAM